jgi:glycerol-3-phosphate dehydrogenase
MVIVGTTDTDYPGDPALVRTEEEDVLYLLGVLDRYFPGAKIRREDIVGCYAGVRPLVDDGSSTESKTSREHAIWTDPSGVTFVAGGKYTTYRNMAEQTVDEVLTRFTLEDRVRFGRSRTHEPLNPLVTAPLWERARNESEHLAERWGIPEKIAAQLAFRHGLEADKIVEESYGLIPSSTDIDEILWGMEAVHAAEHTLCLTLTDFYFRRTPMILARADHGIPFAANLAKVLGHRLNWSDSRRAEEINALQKHLAWELESLAL